MSKQMEIMGQIRSIIVDNLEVEAPEQLQETDRLYEDLGIDSIMVLQLVVYVEEVFGISVPEEDMDPRVFETVGALITFIQELQAAVA